MRAGLIGSVIVVADAVSLVPTLVVVISGPVVGLAAALAEIVAVREVRVDFERMAAVGVCMHKTLRILYEILKDRKPFDPQ